jgi:hypothetical protein
LANLVISDEELAAIRDVLAQQPSVDRNYLIDLVDRTGEVCASVEKIIYIRRRQKI